MMDTSQRPKIQKLSWQEWDMAVRALATKIRNMPTPQFPKQLIGISRGGVIVAAQLSHLLDIPYAHTIHAHCYVRNEFLGDAEIRADKVTVWSAPQLSSKEILESLFCDDMVDSGFTLLELAKKFYDAKFVAPVGRVPGINAAQKVLHVDPTITVYDNRWIEFPWESMLATPNKPLEEIPNAI